MSRNHFKKMMGIMMGAVLAAGVFCVIAYYGNQKQSAPMTSRVTGISGGVSEDSVPVTTRVTMKLSEAKEDTPLSGVFFEVAAGSDNLDGTSIVQAMTGKDGTAEFNVPEGEYTVRWQAENYYGGYQNVTVQGETVIFRKRLIRERLTSESYTEKERWAYILLEWESGENLDLCVYHEESAGWIGIEPTLDAEGCFLAGDHNGDQGYELVLLKDAALGDYRIYVKDCDSILNDRESRMEAEGVVVSIYTAQGMVYQKKAEAGESAGLWECAGLRGGEAAERDRYLYDLADHAWALRDGNDPASWLDEASVKAEEVYTYHHGELYGIRRTEYDANGNEMLYAAYNADGLICRYEYDEDGNRTSLVEYDEESGTVQKRKYEYEYDEDGHWIAAYVFSGQKFDPAHGRNQPVKIRDREFREDGNLIRDYQYNADGLPVYRREWEYDAEGRLISYCYADGEQGNSEEQRYEYDADGNLIRKYDCLRHGVLIYDEYQDEYDADGKQIAHIDNVSGENPERWEYEYDGGGKEIARYGYSYDEGREYLKYQYESEYDENGNLTVYSEYVYPENEEEERRLDHQKIYVYDENDHCITQDLYWYSSDGTPRRRIKYVLAVNGNVMAEYAYEYDGLEVSSEIIDEYEYDEMGNRTEHTRYNGTENETLYENEYVYDARAGMKIKYCYYGDSMDKTITIYDFGEHIVED